MKRSSICDQAKPKITLSYRFKYSSTGIFSYEHDLYVSFKRQLQQKVPFLSNLDLDILENSLHFFDHQGNYRYFNAGVVEKGDSFGELGLLNQKLRSATIVCTENSFLGTLNKRQYE
jgi:hypothetical protein